MEYVYFIQQETTNYVKIGFTKEDPIKRLSTLKTSSPFDLKIIGLIETDNCVKKESDLHNIYKEKRVKGEWFLLSDEEIQFIKLKYNADCSSEFYKYCDLIENHFKNEQKAIDFIKSVYQNLEIKKENISIEEKLIKKYFISSTNNDNFYTSSEILKCLKENEKINLSLRKIGLILRKNYMRTKKNNVYGYQIALRVE